MKKNFLACPSLPYSRKRIDGSRKAGLNSLRLHKQDYSGLRPSEHSGQQIINISKEQNLPKTLDVLSRHGISDATFCR